MRIDWIFGDPLLHLTHKQTRLTKIVYQGGFKKIQKTDTGTHKENSTPRYLKVPTAKEQKDLIRICVVWSSKVSKGLWSLIIKVNNICCEAPFTCWNIPRLSDLAALQRPPPLRPGQSCQPDCRHKQEVTLNIKAWQRKFHFHMRNHLYTTADLYTFMLRLHCTTEHNCCVDFFTQ